jgi:hypothetical protein
LQGIPLDVTSILCYTIDFESLSEESECEKAEEEKQRTEVGLQEGALSVGTF